MMTHEGLFKYLGVLQRLQSLPRYEDQSISPVGEDMFARLIPEA